MSKQKNKPIDGPGLAPPPAEVEDRNEQLETAELAYRRWVEKGCPQGSADEDWYEAENLLRERQVSANTSNTR